jgi:hypothetical protein
MSVSGNPATMYSPSTEQQHIFFRGDGDNNTGFVIEHVFWPGGLNLSSGSVLQPTTYRHRAPHH